MSYYIDIQIACESPLPFQNDILEKWATIALPLHREHAELTLRFVDSREMINLNFTYRQQNKVTNVLAFPTDYPPHIELDFPMLGDIIVCPEVLTEESLQLKTPLEAHWAHIIIHGVLHLLGYDHIKDEDANKMQAIEVKLLAEIGYANPYDIEENELE